MGWPNLLLKLSEERYATLALYGYAWLGGSLGGTLFDLKWLYHSVAKGVWHVERRLWRILIPHISGGYAFAVIVLISSGIFRIFDAATLSRPSVVVGIGFLVGYFSDSAIGKLNEIANTLFGSGGKRYPDDGSAPKKPRASGDPPPVDPNSDAFIRILRAQLKPVRDQAASVDPSTTRRYGKLPKSN